MTRLGRLLLAAALLLPTAAYPQTQPSGINPSAAGKSLSVSNSSSCVAMTQQNTTFVIWNVGSVAAYYNMNGATATTGNPQLPAGSAITVNAAPGSTLCAITASSTTTLQITQGVGFTAIAFGGSVTIAGGTITSNQGTPAVIGNAWPVYLVDTAGKGRGANVDANNNLGVVLPAETSKIIGTVRFDQTTPGTTNGVQVNAALPAGSNLIGGVINGASAYETVAASQTAQAMGATGATGDYLSHCVVTPGTTSPGVVTILDNATAIVSFAGGASSVSNLVPFTIPVGALSVSGAWKITTGANVTVVCVGRFT